MAVLLLKGVELSWIIPLSAPTLEKTSVQCNGMTLVVLVIVVIIIFVEPGAFLYFQGFRFL